MVIGTTVNTLEILRSMNVQRSESAFHHKLADWSPAEWSNAMAGEIGEACEVASEILQMVSNAGAACNLTKKHLRGDFDMDKLREELSKELADVIIYADLLAARCGINLCVAVRNKFNEVSDRRDCKIKMPV